MNSKVLKMTGGNGLKMQWGWKKKKDKNGVDYKDIDWRDKTNSKPV